MIRRLVFATAGTNPGLDKISAEFSIRRQTLIEGWVADRAPTNSIVPTPVQSRPTNPKVQTKHSKKRKQRLFSSHRKLGTPKGAGYGHGGTQRAFLSKVLGAKLKEHTWFRDGKKGIDRKAAFQAANEEYRRALDNGTVGHATVDAGTALTESRRALLATGNKSL